MKNLCSTFIICLMFAPCLYSNTTETFSYTISGFVYDDDTIEPIPGASVYLSGTSIGTQTGRDGAFSFTTSYTGAAQLVVSSIGYKSKSEDLLLTTSGSASYTFFLTTSITELNEIVITSSNEEWQKNYDLFRSFFVGSGQYARSVQLTNSEVLNFEEKENGMVQVTTLAPLIVVNRALGYHIETEFLDVAFNLYDGTGVYKIYTNYSELPEPSDSEKRRWSRNRKTVYEGSSMHFYRSLIKGNHLKEGFSFQTREGGKIQTSDNFSQLIQHYPRMWNLLRVHFSMFELTDEQVVVGYKVRRDINRNIENPDNLTYIKYAGNTPFFLVDQNGVPYDPGHLLYIGKWARERASVLLPTDYDPNE